MIPDDALAKSLNEAIEDSARSERRFWAFTLLWVLGAAAILWFLWVWSRRLDELTTQLQGVQGETSGLVSAARDSKENFERLGQAVKASRADVEVARTALARTQVALEAEQARFEEFASSQRRGQEEFQTDIEKLTKQYEQEIERLRGETVAALKSYQEVVENLNKERAELAAEVKEAKGQVNAMRDRVGNVERQLQASHFVLKTRSRNPVYGMGIFIGFGAWNKSRVGLNDFCLATTQEGDCFWRREFVPLGEPIAVEHDGFAYTITPRYAVGMLVAHDHVGFDILRERLATR
jgi:septal ring factor EnvC (AmiA/AmiB activator)